MSKLDILRRIIREEVTQAIRQELPRIISESTQSAGKVTNSSEYKNKIRDQVRKSVTSGIPLTLNEPTRSAPVKFAGNNPLSQLLNETAVSMTPQDMGEPQEENTAMGSVNEMLSSARKSSNIEMIEINTVPDYSEMMNKMKSKGLM
jgi:hypothetical protein